VSVVRAVEEKERRRLITPEGVDLSLRLADMGQRFSAFLLDLTFLVLTIVAMTLLAGVVFAGAGGEGALVFWLFGFFLLRNGYFIIAEMGPRAATWGKRICGIRVVARSGGRLTADAVIARNLLREIEFYLPLAFLFYETAEGAADVALWLTGLGWTCFFLFFPFFNRDRLRIGDLLAGTWVIQAPKRKLGRELLRDRSEAPAGTFTDEQLDAYGVFELQTLEQVLRLDNDESLASVSYAIRNKLGIGDNRAFLHAYYEALRARLERKLLFGRRRVDKWDVEG
jgi:uncharacterized RDD family membrane protein YckC